MAQPEPAVLGGLFGLWRRRHGTGARYSRVPTDESIQVSHLLDNSSTAMGGGRLCEAFRIGRSFTALLTLLLALVLLLGLFPQALSPAMTRTLAILLVLVAGLTGALLPWWLRAASSDYHIWMARGNCLSAGVMFAAGVIHLLGDSTEQLAPLTPCSPGLHGCNGQLLRNLTCPATKGRAKQPQNYPKAMLLCTLGFMLTFVIEEVGYWLNQCIQVEDSIAAVDDDDTRSLGSDSATTPTPVTVRGHMQQLQPVAALDLDAARRPSTMFTKLMLAAALSFHSIMEGMALGAVPSADVLEILLTILAHKSLAAFALGSTLLAGDDAPSPVRFVGVAVLFSIASPAGSVMAIWADTEEPEFAPVVLALSSGTFICT